MNKNPENQIKKITANCINILIIAMFILTCLFSANVKARGEIPNNLIEEKNSTINEINLGASQGISLEANYNKTAQSVTLNWTAVEGATKYKVYQSQEGKEDIVYTTSETSITIPNIKDETPPTKPTITATQTADGLGNNITIGASTDNGTTYRHSVRKILNSAKSNADVIFLVDLSNSMSKAGFIGIFGANDGPIITISQMLIDKGMRVGSIVMASYDENQIIGPFTNSINKVREYVTQYRGRANHQFANGIRTAISMFNSSGQSQDKIIILFTDSESDYENNGESVVEKQQALREMQNAGIKLYAIYRDNPGYVKDYCNKYIIEPAADKEKQVKAFNTIFNEMLEDIEYKSNTVSTTVTSGIKGYQYAITTSSTHTFTNEPIVPISEIPTYISGVDQMVQYLHVRAVDNNGLASTTNSILLQVPAKITLKSNYIYGMNKVPLSWKINDKRPGYVYRLYQRAEGQEKFTQIASSNSKTVIAKQETIVKSYTTSGGPYTWTVPKGVTSIKVTVAGAGGGAGGCVKYHYTAGDRDRDVYADVRGGNGGQGELIEKQINVKEGEKYTIKIGKAGTTGSRNYLFEYTAASAYAGNGSNGQSSSFGSIIAKGRRRRNWRKSNR